MPPSSESESSLSEVLAQSQATAREQLAAAWQLQVDRIQEQLSSGWREQIERVFDERFTEMAGRLEGELEDRLSKARRDLSNRLNQAARRVRQAESTTEWSKAVTDATHGFVARSAVFRVAGPRLRGEASRGYAAEGQPDPVVGIETPLASAPAFAGAAESMDMVVALGTPFELSPEVASALGTSDGHKVYLFPIFHRQKTVAVLYAEPSESGLDAGALELVAGLAGSAWEDRQNLVADRSSGLVMLTAATQPEKRVTPSWAAMSEQEREAHLRAQRFARVQAAEMRLYKSAAVKTGRDEQDIYRALKPEIDKGRAEFRQKFMEGSPSMVDYFHLELLRTLAHDDIRLLGPDYPGPLV